MLQLYINDRPAVIASGSTIRLTRENPIYSTAEDYTFDVTLPLRGCPENQNIFGPIHCPYHSQAIKPLQFYLVAPPVTLTGTATVTQINETEARIQLRSALPSLTSLAPTDANKRDTYIDTLPLGCPYPWGDPSTHVHPYSWRTLAETGGDLNKYKRRYRYTDLKGQFTYNNIPYPFHRYPQWCRFPYLNNELKLKDDFSIITTNPTAHSISDIRVTIGKTSVGCHPGLLYMLQRVLEACHLKVTTHIPQDDWLWHIYILNVRGLDDFATMLPHWTVEDFAEQVACLLSLRLVRHADTIHISRRQADLDNAERTAIPLQAVIDTRTTDIDPQADTTTDDDAHTPFGNSYQMPEDSPLLQVPDEVWQNADIRTYPDLHSIQTFVSSLSKEDQESSRWLFIAEDTGRAYAILSHTSPNNPTDTVYWELTRVDHLGPYLPSPTPRTDREAIHQLRIVPARLHILPNVYYDVYNPQQAQQQQLQQQQTQTQQAQTQPQQTQQQTQQAQTKPQQTQTKSQQLQQPQQLQAQPKSSSHAALFLPVASDTNQDYTTHYNVDQAINPDPSGPNPPHIDQKPDYIEVFYLPPHSLITQPTLHNPDLHPDPTYNGNPESIGIFPLAIGTPYIPVVNYAYTSDGWTEETTNHHLHFYHPTYNDNNPLDPFSLNDYRTARAYPPYPTLLNEYGCPSTPSAPSSTPPAPSSTPSTHRGKKIDTTTTITAQFTDNVPCDPSAFYNLAGRLYACQKFELSLDTEGLHPIKTGYFYPIISEL